MKEEQKKMLEAVETYNENIELLGKSFGEGMKTLDQLADDHTETLSKIEEEMKKLQPLMVLRLRKK